MLEQRLIINDIPEISCYYESLLTSEISTSEKTSIQDSGNFYKNLLFFVVALIASF